MNFARHLFGIVVLTAITATLAACTGAPVEPTRAPVPAPTQSPSASAEPAPDPVLVPEGSADDNLPYFDFVNSAFLSNGNPGGQPIIDNLVAAGFDKAAMEVTADRTPLGSAVDSLQFAVRIGDDCLLGQADAGGYTGTAASALESGRCLVGNTRAIDW